MLNTEIVNAVTSILRRADRSYSLIRPVENASMVAAMMVVDPLHATSIKVSDSSTIEQISKSLITVYKTSTRLQEYLRFVLETQYVELRNPKGISHDTMLMIDWTITSLVLAIRIIKGCTGVKVQYVHFGSTEEQTSLEFAENIVGHVTDLYHGIFPDGCNTITERYLTVLRDIVIRDQTNPKEHCESKDANELLFIMVNYQYEISKHGLNTSEHPHIANYTDEMIAFVIDLILTATLFGTDG